MSSSSKDRAPVSGGRARRGRARATDELAPAVNAAVTPVPAPASPEAAAGRTLRLPSSLTIAFVGAVRVSLLQALGDKGPLLLDASGVEAVDVAGLQLLCAAHRQAETQGTALGFCGGGRGALPAAAAAAGFDHARGGPSGCRFTEHDDG